MRRLASSTRSSGVASSGVRMTCRLSVIEHLGRVARRAADLGDRETVREVEVVHGRERGGAVGASGRVGARPVAEVGRAPRLVERRPGVHAVAERLDGVRGVFGEAQRRVAVRPSRPGPPAPAAGPSGRASPPAGCRARAARRRGARRRRAPSRWACRCRRPGCGATRSRTGTPRGPGSPSGRGRSRGGGSGRRRCRRCRRSTPARAYG